MWLLNDSLYNIRDFLNDPVYLLHGKSSKPVNSFHMAYRKVHHITGLEEIKEVLVSKHKQFVGPPKARYYFSLNTGRGLIGTDGKEWAQQRKRANPLVKKAQIDKALPVLIKTAENVAEVMTEHRQPQDLFHAMMGMALHLICQLSFGFYDQKYTEKIGNAMSLMNEEAYKRIIAPFNIPVIIPTWSNIRYYKSRKIFDRFVREMVSRALTKDDHESFAAKYSLAYEGIPKKNLIEHLAVLLKTVVAGNETIATGLTWCLFELNRHPEILADVMDELKSFEIGSVQSAEELFVKTQFTQMVLKETLRLYPPIWLLGRMAIDDVTIGNTQIQKKEDILISPLVVHRMEKYWKEPLTFNPQRFENKPELVLESAFFPFGLGPRGCIGGYLAVLQMTVVLATLYQQYNVNVSTHDNTEFQPYIIMRPKHTIPFALTPIKEQESISV